VNQETISKT